LANSTQPHTLAMIGTEYQP